ncbi:MAG TPA: S49 family peptidase [Oceanospirillaceae bacterium]|nr:S49 family peptidase [Oceanospirillaceae bacterium]
MVTSIQREQKSARRWGIFFKSLSFVFVFTVLAMLLSDDDVGAMAESQDHVAVVDVFGPIMAGAEASADHLLPALSDAFEAANSKAVLLNINSPGGSPVQAGIVFDELQLMKLEYPNKPVYAVIADVGASGAYYIAAAADFIYADKASTVGSIGVIGSGFGFDQSYGWSAGLILPVVIKIFWIHFYQKRRLRRLCFSAYWMIFISNLSAKSSLDEAIA